MEIQDIRKKILQVLYDAYHQELGRDQLEREELAQRLGLDTQTLKKGLEYLVEKQYVESIETSIVPPVVLNYLRITSTGIDLVEGRREDAQIIFVEGDYIHTEIGDNVQNVVAGKGISGVSQQIGASQPYQFGEVLTALLNYLDSHPHLSAAQIETVKHQVEDLLESLKDLRLI